METTTLPQVKQAKGERRMTYQVTLCGSDGVVVASDRCEAWQEETGGISRNRVNKLLLDKRSQIAWTFSGGHFSGITARYLRDALEQSPTNDEAAILEMLKESGNKAFRNFASPPKARVTDIVVLVFGNSQRIVRAHPSTETLLEDLEDKCVSGETDSLVNYFPEHFYSRNMCVRELASLAGYAVRMAHELDPKYVYGLDLAIYQNSTGSFQFADRDTCWHGAAKLDDALRNFIKAQALSMPFSPP